MTYKGIQITSVDQFCEMFRVPDNIKDQFNLEKPQFDVRVIIKLSTKQGIKLKSVIAPRGLSVSAIPQYQEYCLKKVKSNTPSYFDARILPLFMIRKRGEGRYSLVEKIPENIFIK